MIVVMSFHAFGGSGLFCANEALAQTREHIALTVALLRPQRPIVTMRRSLPAVG